VRNHINFLTSDCGKQKRFLKSTFWMTALQFSVINDSVMRKDILERNDKYKDPSLKFSSNNSLTHFSEQPFLLNTTSILPKDETWKSASWQLFQRRKGTVPFGLFQSRLSGVFHFSHWLFLIWYKFQEQVWIFPVAEWNGSINHPINHRVSSLSARSNLLNKD